MSEKWIVFGGWAVKPEILSPLFGPDSVYIDSNSLMEEIIDQGKLKPNWIELLKTKLSVHFKSEIKIAGWSTGAMIALGLSSVVNPSAMVLISSTPSFIRRTDFHFGTRSSVLSSMRGALRENWENVVTNFLQRCGISQMSVQTGEVAALESGLHFLEQADLRSIDNINTLVLLIHGTDDRIVPADAGKYLSARIKGDFHELAGPHAIFLNNEQTILMIIEAFSKRRL